MAFCNMCGAQIADGTTTCAACASRQPAAAPLANAPAQGMSDNVVGMLAYFTFIPAIIFLVLEPYNKSRFVRFHSFQMLFFCGALFILHMALWIFTFVPLLVFVTFPLHILIWLASVALWFVLVIKANQGQMYKLPYIGDLAEQQANAM